MGRGRLCAYGTVLRTRISRPPITHSAKLLATESVLRRWRIVAGGNFSSRACALQFLERIVGTSRVATVTAVLSPARDHLRVLSTAAGVSGSKPAAPKVRCAFFRMHPLVENVQWLPADAVVRADRETVYVPLDRGIADAWERAGSRHRNMVNRGRKTGTTIEWNTPALWDTFVPLYRSAMGRLSAPSRLNFGSEYFATLRMIPGAEIVGTTDSDGLVSAAIFLFGPRWAHYHLAARRCRMHLTLRPTC